MNHKEFTALKVGDKIENAMTHGEGVVSVVTELRSDRAVSVKWGASHPPHGGIEFSYSTHSTAWMHWNKVPPIVGGEFLCMCGRGDKPCPGPDGKPLCYNNQTECTKP